jgi:hypothetical protein
MPSADRQLKVKRNNRPLILVAMNWDAGFRRILGRTR